MNIANGLLNIRTRELYPHSPDFLSLNQLKVRYDPLARAKRFNRFIEESLPDVDQRLLAIDFFASCLWRTCRLKKSLLLVGPTDTGKSTFLNLIIRFLGEENVSDVALQDLESNRFQLVNLVGKLANIYADIDRKELAQSRRFKTTTGGDRVTVERKFMQSFETYIYAKDLFSANQIPDTQDESDAFFNRWIVIPFEEQIPPELQDKNLFEKLTTEKELSGILNILLKRLRWVIKSKTIPNTPTVEETRSIWLGRSDFVRMFLNETVQLEPESVLGRAEFYSSYISWCRLRKITPKSEVMFNRKVELLGAIKTQTRVEGEPRKVWKGIAPKSKEIAQQREENLQVSRKNRELRIQNRRGVPKATTISNYCLNTDALDAFASMLQHEESEQAKEEGLSQFTILTNGLFQCGFCQAYRTSVDCIKAHITEEHIPKLLIPEIEDIHSKNPEQFEMWRSDYDKV